MDEPYGTGGETGSTGSIAFVLGNMGADVDYVTMWSKRNGQAAQQWNCVSRTSNDWYQITGRDRGWRHQVRVRAAVPLDNGLCLNGPWLNGVGAPKPNPPTSATVEIGVTTLTLDWTKPSDHNETSWQVGYSTDTSDTEPDTTLSGFTTGSSKTITGLTATTQYKLFVRSVVLNTAQDTILPGATSSWLTKTATTASTLPAITDVEGTGDGDDSSAQGTLRVTVDGTTLPSGTTHLRLQPRQSNNNFENLFPAVNTNHVYDISNRVRGYRYEVQVAACTGTSVPHCGPLGDGFWGALRPSPLTSLSTSEVQSDSITLAWTGPSNYPDGFFETGYNTDTHATEPLPATTGSFTQNLSYEITGLSTGTEYEVGVKATNTHGDSLWTASETSTPIGDTPDPEPDPDPEPGAPPNRPRNLELTAHNQALAASWDASDSGAAVDSYTVLHRARPSVERSDRRWVLDDPHDHGSR